MCLCPKDRFGFDCEFSDICPSLVVNTDFGAFQSSNSTFGTQFDLFHNPETGYPVRVYDMPVYYSKSTFPANIIFFAGQRWVLTDELLLNMTQTEMLSSGIYFPQETANALEHPSFHGHFQANYAPFFMSDAVEFQTPSFQATPSGLGWSSTAALVERGTPIDTVLVCQSCSAEHGGHCDSAGGGCNITTGTCDCNPGFSGDRCELQEKCYEQEHFCEMNGVCDLTSGVCRCHAPHYGNLCEFAYSCFEEDGKCYNGGTCDAASGVRYCKCPDPATFGESCEKREQCTIQGCRNGGICDANSGSCDCPSPFEGHACDLVSEALQEQENKLCLADDECSGGTCDLGEGKFRRCTCDDPNTYGIYCEHRYDCTHSGCTHDGLCNSDTGLCECLAPYTGPACAGVPDCSRDSDCRRNGICDVSTGVCDCGDAHADGKLCENGHDCRVRNDGCYHDGLCLPNGQCNCNFPYSGDLCEITLDVGQ